MDDRRFDSAVKALAAGHSRRSVLKGLLGLGGAALVGTVVADSDADAAVRKTPTPTPVKCPGNQTNVGGVCTCPPSAPNKCGPACCTGKTTDSYPRPPSHTECCSNACCNGTCYGEEACCPTNTRAGGLPPTHVVCDGPNGKVCIEGVCCSDSDCGNPCQVCNQQTHTCMPNANGTVCNDGNACTQIDTCQNGVCVGSNPVICQPLDQCHVAGTCDPATGTCSNPNAPNGTTCDDGNACTQSSTCQNGVCTGGNPVICQPLDQCHVAGTCDPATGQCSNPNAPNGTICDDGNACTQTDTCQNGVCTGSNPVICQPLDQCHVAGTCDPATGTCSNPIAPDGTACTQSSGGSGFCVNGTCGQYCPVGMYFDSSSGVPSCVICPPGYYCPGSNAKFSCPPGTYNPNQGSVDGSACVLCPAGTANPNYGAAACNACSPGFYSSITGLYSCIPCTSGTYAAGSGNTTCTPCSCNGQCQSCDQAQGCVNLPSVITCNSGTRCGGTCLNGQCVALPDTCECPPGASKCGSDCCTSGCCQCGSSLSCIVDGVGGFCPDGCRV